MDHDRLFKELLTTFFVEFVELFYPRLAAYLDADSVTFLDKELFTDLTQGERHEADLVVRANFRDQPLCFLIHVETQARAEAGFPRRMFSYFARLHERHDLPVYPIAVFSYDQPQRPEPDAYRVAFADLEVLSFRFRALQLNQLDWEDFVDRTNPIAAALMARMRMAPIDRPRVKLACLRMLARLQLDPARRALISGFADNYLRLTMGEKETFGAELEAIDPHEREEVMEIVTSWMEEGIEKGMERGREEGMERGMEKGREEGERALVLRQLRKRLGDLDRAAESRIGSLSLERLGELGEALLDFVEPDDLAVWLEQLPE
jgi:predicted transposase YdaD